MTLLYIILAIIAYYIYRIYRQRQNEIDAIAGEKADAEYEKRRKERFKDYPHLIDKIDDSWIEVFSRQSNIDGKNYLLKSMFFLKVGEST